MKIYTGTGDRGTTRLLGRGRIRKDARRLAVIGTLDESSAAIGAAAALLRKAPLRRSLARLQEDLLELGAHLATPAAAERPSPPPGRGRIEELEREIDRMEAALPTLRNFILPGGCPAAALLHLARAITRRAEREIVALARTERVSPAVLVYANRLSDYLFVAARFANRRSRTREVVWRPSHRAGRKRP